MTTNTQNQEKEATGLGVNVTQKVQSNIDSIELELETQSQWFKPKDGNTYLVEIDLEKHKIVPVESEKFKDAKGNPLKQFQFIVKHQNGVEQEWNISSKTLVKQLLDEIRKGYKFIRVSRVGSDKRTEYKVQGVQ